MVSAARTTPRRRSLLSSRRSSSRSRMDESGFGFGGTAVWSGGVLRCDTYSMLYGRQILTVVDGATVTECF